MGSYRQGDGQHALLRKILARLEQIDGVAPTTRRIDTAGSLTGGGDLNQDRVFSLVGDSDSPGIRKYYGTDGTGTKGFYTFSNSLFDGAVDTWDDLPVSLVAAPVGSLYVVLQSSGVWFVDRKEAGTWYRATAGGTSADWVRLGNFDEMMVDDNLRIRDDGDPTKEIGFELSNLSSGATRTIQFQDRDGTLAYLDDLTGFQTASVDLTAIAAQTGAGVLQRIGSGDWGLVDLATVATSGSYNDLLDLPSFAAVALSGLSADLTYDHTTSGLTASDVQAAIDELAANTQPLDSDLTAIAALTTTSFGRALLTKADASAVRAYIGASSFSGAFTDLTGVPTTLSGYGIVDAQPLDADLTAIAALSTDAFGRALLTKTDGSSVRSYIGAGTSSFSGAFSALSGIPANSAGWLHNDGAGALSYSTPTKSDVGLGNVENTALSTWAGSANITTLGTIATGIWNGTTIAIANGGTGQSSKAAAFDALSPFSTLGDTLYGGASGTGTRLAGNTTTTRKFYRQVGNGTVSAAPAWDTLLAADIPDLSLTYQPLNAKLTSIGALANSAGALKNDGSGTFSYATIREVLTSARTYYVRTDGSDSNNGLANTSGGAFLTIQKAVNSVCSLIDNSGFSVTIQIGDGTYNESVLLGPYVGNGIVIVQGNSVTPANVVVNGGSTGPAFINGFSFSSSVVTPSLPWTIKNLKVTTSGGGFAGIESVGGPLTLSGINFGACNGAHLAVFQLAQVLVNGACTISGNATLFVDCSANSYTNLSNQTITLSGTPAFSTDFFRVANGAVIRAANVTFSGSATGTRFSADRNGVIDIAGNTPNTYIPGNANGVTSNGGLCV